MNRCLHRAGRPRTFSAGTAPSVEKHHARWPGILLLGFLLLVCLSPQDLWAQDADTTEHPPIVSSVRFRGNDLFSDASLRLRIRTAANRRTLGIPGFTWWLWLYRLGASGTFGDRLGQALMATGEPPAYLDTTVVRTDAERLLLFYRQEGFRRAEVAATIDTLDGGRRVHVLFDIDPGTPTFLRRITYEGLDRLSQEQKVRLARGSLLRPAHVDEGAPLQFVAHHRRYSETMLHEERRRLLTFLRNEGYASVTRDSIRAIVFPAGADSFDVTLRVRPGPRYRFGDVHFEVVGPELDAARRSDSLEIKEENGGFISWRIDQESRLEPGLLLRTLQFRPGAWYNQSQLFSTKRRLEATGLFSYTDITALAPETGPAGVPRLSHRIEARTRPRHQIRFETFMIQRTVLGGTDSDLGAGVGVSYENVNLLGGGEAFRIRTAGSLAGDFSERSFGAAQAEVTTSLALPYLMRPFSRLDRWFRLYQSRTRFSLSLLTARREELSLIIRGRGTARTRLEMHHTPTVSSLVDLLDVSLSNPDTLPNFEKNFFSGVLDAIDDEVQRAQILEDYTQPQINNAFRYTLRSSTVNPLRRERGYSYEAAVEIGGNLPYLFDRWVFTPDTLEGSLPGLPFFGGDRPGSRLLYRQYIRLAADLRRYRPLNATNVLAFKLVAGFAHPTGGANVVPFDRRFFSGGATSVRGWHLRELGPGAANFEADDDTQRDDTNILGGDVKLELSAEVRSTVLRNVLAADWITVLFADAGNVWFGPRNPGFSESDAARESGRFALDSFYRELGVGAGVGLRIAWEYLIVRLDRAYQVHDPADPGSGVFEEPKWYFGIGHTF